MYILNIQKLNFGFIISLTDFGNEETEIRLKVTDGIIQDKYLTG